MKAFYTDESNTIYCGKAEIILPQLDPFGLLLTDPPYGVEKLLPKSTFGRDENKSRTRKARAKDWGELRWDKEPPPDWMFGLMRAKAEKQIIWGGNYFALPPSSCWLVWDKDNSENDYADCELAWTNLPRAIRKFRWKWHGMLQEDMSRKEVRTHPTQKPLGLIKWCITLAGQVSSIVDPYMGSGTTLRAAKDFNIPAIGIDQDERCCEDAAKRLAQEVFEFTA